MNGQKLRPGGKKGMGYRGEEKTTKRKEKNDCANPLGEKKNLCLIKKKPNVSLAWVLR